MSTPNLHGSSDDWNKLKHLVDLSAENARLKAEVERLRASSFVTAVPVEQYERLRKAGDALALSVGADWAINGPDDGTEPESVKAWNAAKEGKPSV